MSAPIFQRRQPRPRGARPCQLSPNPIPRRPRQCSQIHKQLLLLRTLPIDFSKGTAMIKKKALLRVPTTAKQDQQHLRSARTQVRSEVRHSCGVSCNHPSELIPGPGISYAMGWPKKKKPVFCTPEIHTAFQINYTPINK